MTIIKGNSLPNMSEQEIRDTAIHGDDKTRRVNPGDIAGSIFTVDGGINIIADLLNDRITNNEAAKRLFDIGVYTANSDPPTPLSKQLIQYHKNKVKKRLGIKKRDKNVFYVPFITSEVASNYLKKAQTEINEMDANNPANKNFKIDPILGLHMMAMELEALAETVQLDFKETLQLKKLKMLIFEKLNKLDDDKERDLTKKALIQKLDDLSRFHADLHIVVNEAFEELTSKITSLIDMNNEHLPQISQIFAKFKKIINVKDKYIEYIKSVNISGEELESVFETTEEYFEPIDIEKELEV